MTDQHLSLDALADLLAAEGSADDEAHVGACPGCAGRLDELAAAEVEVAAVLAALPPPPVPDGLAARLHAVLDAEPPLAPSALPSSLAAGGGGGQARGSATVTPFPQRGRGRRPAWLPAAAAAVVLLGGAAVGAAVLGGDGGSSSTDTAAGSAGGATSSSDGLGDLPRSQTGTDYAAAGSLAAALPALLDASAPERAPDSAEDSAENGPEGEVEALSTPSTGPDGALDRLRTPAGLASCLTALLPPDSPDLRPLAVDYAAYAGQPALAVVLPAEVPDRVDVFVVGAGCTAGDDATLFFTQLDRP